MSRWGDLAVDLHAARFAHLAAVGEVRRADGVLAVATGASSNTENGVVSTGPALAAGLAEQLVAWFADARLPASWLHLGGAAPEGVCQALAAAGCREETTGVDMGRSLEGLQLDARPPEGVRIDEALAEEDVDAWLDVAGACGWLDGGADRAARKRAFVAFGLGPGRPLRHWIARRGERAVAFASAFLDDGAALLDHMAVLPDERRRGIGTALAHLRLREAQAHGCRAAALAPSPDGEQLYRRLGFELVPTPPRRWFYLPPAATR
jgi:GNAT superfamily N-acetyltransferase